MKRLPLILVFLLIIPFVLGAAPPGNATLSLNTRVNTIFLHGFFGPDIELSNYTEVTTLNVFDEFDDAGFFEEDVEYTDIIGIIDNTLDYEDIPLFDFGESFYDIGYYLFLSNEMGNYEVKFAISPFYSTKNTFTVPWTLQVDYKGGNTSFTGSDDFASGGTFGFNGGTTGLSHPIFTTGADKVHKFAALKLTMKPYFVGNDETNSAMIPAGDDYIATVVASITSP